MHTIPPEFSRYLAGLCNFDHTSWQEACFMGFLSLEWLLTNFCSFCRQLSLRGKASSRVPWSCHINHVRSTILSNLEKRHIYTFLADEKNPGANHYTALLLRVTMMTCASNNLPKTSVTYHSNDEYIAFTVTSLCDSRGSPVEVTVDS